MAASREGLEVVRHVSSSKPLAVIQSVEALLLIRSVAPTRPARNGSGPKA
jgi:hypothetical protein